MPFVLGRAVILSAAKDLRIPRSYHEAAFTTLARGRLVHAVSRNLQNIRNI
jgi:hypothetical protein